MKSIIRNFIYVFRRFKTATILNILGLSVAFAAFLVIMIQVRSEYSFDKIYPTSERIFRANFSTSGNDIFGIILPRPFVESIITSSPHIEAGTIINPFIGEVYITITQGGEKQGFREPFVTCSPAITHVFGFRMVEGDIDCLKNPENVIIPKSMAKKMFGKQTAIGERIHCEEDVWSKSLSDLVVGGVYEDLPDNAQLNNVIYTAMDETHAMENWEASNYMCYLLLDNKSASQNVTENFNKTFDYSKMNWEDAKKKIALTPLTDIYFKNEMQDGNILKSGNKQSTDIIFFIAILVIIIAAINFMNFSTALAPVRIKSLNTQKVLGCSTAFLRYMLLVETICIASLSFILSLVYIFILNKTALLSFISADLTLSNNILLIVLAGVIALFIGFLAGLYPAFYMTSFSPALVIKGSFGMSPTGKRLRTILVGFQFIISITLIIASTFIWMQSDYMQKHSLGFDKDQIAIVELNKGIFKNFRSVYENELKEYAGIEDVAFSSQKLGSRDSYSTSGITYNEEEFSTYVINITYNFLEVMGIPLLEGRKPTPADEESIKYIFMVNENIHDKYDVVPTPSISIFGRESSIIGVTGNVKFTSLRKQNDNVTFMTNVQFPLTVSYIRLKAGTDYYAAVEHIRKTVAKIDPSFPFEVEFYDSLFNQLYQKEENFRKMITLFCMLAIIISIVGVFGIIIFETEYRRKEIGIHKVMGATVYEALLMLSKSYIVIIAVSFMVAVPLAYYGVSSWLASFAFRIPMYWWVFLMSGIIVFLITLITVNWQSWKAANTNPVDVLKNE
ncbi:MAG: FtsX-like permease family protein [Dysgonomonas sp.]|nr:FtsX-like permease family protein [Dysgonomonas sp.]